MRCYLGPWVRDRGAFAPPPGAVALVDLSPPHLPGSRGLFAAARLGLDYQRVADPARLSWDALTTRSAPDGLGRPRPLVPTTAGRLELHLGPLGRVRADRFAWGLHPHTGRLRDQLRGQFALRWESGEYDHARRCLDFEREKYALADGLWRELVPPRLRPYVEGPLPHQTTITESFNKADSTTLGPDLSWTEISGGWEVVSNRCRKSTGSDAQSHCARADSDLSSADHYAQIASYYPGNTSYHGPACRLPGTSTETFYSFVTASEDGTGYLVKMVAAAQTNIATGSVGTRTDGTLVKVEANGSTITGYFGGSSAASTTDTAITGNVRAGLNQYHVTGTTGTFDSFEAADLGGAAGQPTMRRTGGVSPAAYRCGSEGVRMW
jgi:hypothetical protein